MSRKVYAVAVVGTLTDAGGQFLPGALDWLLERKIEKADVILHDPIFNTDTGWRLVVQWFLEAGAADLYTDAWMHSGCPVADVYVGANYETLN